MSDTREHFCGVHARVGTGSICRWDKSRWDGARWVGEPRPLDLPWAVDRSVPSPFLPALTWAWEQWAKVCAIAPRRVTNLAEALHVVTVGRIDGAGSTLAWAQLPCGRDTQLQSKFDAGERWHLDPTTQPARGTIHLGGVACHEFGHAIGLDHDPTPARSLLDPTYAPDVLTPQAWDIAQAQLRYGPPIVETPTPPPGAADPDPVARCQVVIAGVVYRGDLKPAS